MTFNPNLLTQSWLYEAARFVHRFQTLSGMTRDGKAGLGTYTKLDEVFTRLGERVRAEEALSKIGGGQSDAQPLVKFQRLPHAADLPLPAYETPGAAGMDLRAALGRHGKRELSPGARYLIATGFKVAIPSGYEGQVRPRSGLAMRLGVTVLNSPGTIDSDYRGEIMVMLINHGRSDICIKDGDRIAQLVIAPVSQARVAGVAELDDTQRGDKGFGSTGVN